MDYHELQKKQMVEITKDIKVGRILNIVLAFLVFVMALLLLVIIYKIAFTNPK